MLRVYYYIIDGTVYVTCCKGVMPGKLSPVWDCPSACAWIVPGFTGEDDDDEL